MLFIFGLIFLIVFFVVLILIPGTISILNIPSLFLILVPLLFFIITSKSGESISRYFKSSFKKDYPYTITELEELSLVIKNIIKFTLATGGFCSIIFVMISLSFLNVLERLGPNLAICLTTISYSIAISYFIFFPTQAWAENKVNELKKNTQL